MFIKTKVVALNLLRPSRALFFSTNTSVKENKITVGKHEINYLRVGNGPHNIFCAPCALGTIWTVFKPQIEGFMKDKFTLIVWDPPGYGKSYPPLKEFTVDFLEKDADAAYEFMKVLQIPKYSVLGFSDGAMTSLILAAKYPNAVNKLVVWGGNTFILSHELEAYEKIRDINNWSKKMYEPLTKEYGKEMLAKYWASWIDGMVNVYQNNKGNICSEFLKDIKCPTYILYGEKDPLVDPVHVSHLQTNIKGSRVHLYPEGKHHLHLSYTEDFNKRVQEFLLEP